MQTEDKKERILAAARQRLDRHHVLLSVLAQGENSPYMTDEFKERLVEAKEKLAAYKIAGHGEVK